MMRLYQNQLSPYCHRVRIVLAEKELDYQVVNVDLLKNEQHTDQFLRLNPLAKVPVLADDGLVLNESLLINEYLNEEYPYPALMPEAEDTQGRALVRYWAKLIDSMISSPCHELFLAESAKKGGGAAVDSQIITASHEKIQKFLELATRSLDGGEYIAGRYSLADIAFAPWLAAFERFSIEIPEGFSSFRTWMKRLSGRPAVHQTK